jgi:hypothetical protein
MEYQSSMQAYLAEPETSALYPLKQVVMFAGFLGLRFVSLTPHLPCLISHGHQMLHEGFDLLLNGRPWVFVFATFSTGSEQEHVQHHKADLIEGEEVAVVAAIFEVYDFGVCGRVHDGLRLTSRRVDESWGHLVTHAPPPFRVQQRLL